MAAGHVFQITFPAMAFVALIGVGAFGSRGEPKADTSGKETKVQTLPKSRGGQDLVGARMPDLHFARWLNTDDNRPLDTAGSVVLYRWWTNGCPYCKASLPGIESLRKKYADNGLKVVAVYHPKPPRDAKDLKDDVVRQAAEKIGYKGAVALDPDWSALKRAYLNSGDRSATSVSFLVDRHGVIRFVHPGPDFFPSDDPASARQDEDYRLIESAIADLLAEAQAKH